MSLAIDQAIEDAKFNGKDRLCIPTSGAVLQAMQLRLGRASSKKIDNPENSDLFTFKGANDQWEIRHVFDGFNGVPCDDLMTLDKPKIDFPKPKVRGLIQRKMSKFEA